jgi:meso-butanediol dehydrogenase / (S,S)-butanediol dehydrogenase / diacetyl reductase
MLLNGKTIFLTGGASGIGLACAKAYAAEGAQVVIADINGVASQQVAKGLGSSHLGLQCDVANGQSVESAVRTAQATYGRIDAVHNNAGIASPSKTLEETSEEEWDSLMNINLKSIYWTTRAALPELRKSKGVILNTASMVGLIGQGLHAAYTASKGGMIALTKSMALDYAPVGIRVNAICPAGVWTPTLKTWCSEQPNSVQIETYLNEIHALGYCPEGDVIADAATFLLSDKARFMTGCILPVSGGAELGYRR